MSSILSVIFIIMKRLIAIALILFFSGCIPEIPIINEKKGGGGSARALFFTAGFTHTDPAVVSDIASKIAKSPYYNSVLSVLDLQSGRSYIFGGRSGVGIHPQAIANINTFKSKGVRPIVIIRNDWAARTGRGSIPSIGGRGSNSNFYTQGVLSQEVIFISNFNDSVKGVDIMYAFEPSSPASVGFYLELIKKARSVGGFGGKIYVNFIGNAKTESNSRWSEFSSMGVLSATSQNTTNWNLNESVINTDGNTSINASNAPEVIKAIRETGKPYFIWAPETAGYSVPDSFF